VRVDVAVGQTDRRKRFWIELLCCLLLALPFAAIVFYYGIVFAHQSWVQGETSASPVGLPMRWIPKSIVAAGFGLLTLAILAVMARLVVALFGSPSLSARAASEVKL
jgi:TRAP-type mannitol/chloroaromatic compound transport system permease small subunit